MIEFSIPPKPGEVTLDAGKFLELLSLPGALATRREVAMAAGFTIGSILVNECETVEDLSTIVEELTDQADIVLVEHASMFATAKLNPMRVSSAFHRGLERGRIVTVEA